MKLNPFKGFGIYFSCFIFSNSCFINSDVNWKNKDNCSFCLILESAFEYDNLLFETSRSVAAVISHGSEAQNVPYKGSCLLS